MAEKPKTDSTPDAGKKEKDTLARKAYGEAMAALRDAHRDEFEALLSAKQAAYGVEVRRRLSPAERAERAAAEAVEKAAKAEAKRQAKIRALEEQIAALTGGEQAPVVSDDPLAVFSA
jgi:hypothetical protein